MSVSENIGDVFQRDVYEQTYSEIRDLKARLPQDVVQLLAREVLVRLSVHFDDADHITPAQVEELALALISNDPAAAAALVTKERATGKSLKTLYLSYLGAAAKKLGVWWEMDKVDFTQVVTGTGRIYAIMRGLKAAFDEEPLMVTAKSAFFASVPGETHVIGIKMAADLIRRDGWEIDLEVGQEHDALLNQILTSNQRIVGLSGSGVHTLPALAKLVVAIRLAAPKVLIMVSGPIVDEAPDEVRLMGVDGMASDYDSALLVIEDLWTTQIARR